MTGRPVRVLLAYKCSDDGRSDFFERILPVGLPHLRAAAIAAGHDVRLANWSGSGWAAVERRLREERPDVVGISTFTFNRRASLELARRAKRVLPGCRVVLGGPHASHLHRRILEDHPAVDFVVIGEGEGTLVALLDALAAGRDPGGIRGLAWRRDGGTRDGGWPEPIADLDRLPQAADGFEAEGVDPRTQLMYVVTSRGCPARCTFCNTPEFWGTRIRFRSVDHVLAELRLLRERYGLLYVSFRDDTFTVHRRRILELCRRMEEERLYFLWDCQSRVNAVDGPRLDAMRRAGCLHVQYGVESGSARMLDRLNKDIRADQVEAAAAATREAGLVFSVYLISGIDGETDEDVDATLALLERIRPHDAMVSPLAVFPGTKIWDDYRRSERLDDGYWSGPAREDVYVRTGDAAAERSLGRIGAAMERIARESAYGLDDYRRQRRRLGECHAIDLGEADLLLERGEASEAVAVLGRLIAREPGNPWGHLRLGQLALARRRPGEARERLEEAVRLVPRLAEGWTLLGDAWARLDRPSEAAEAYAAAVGADAGARRARRALRRLGAIEASAPVGPRPSGRASLVRN